MQGQTAKKVIKVEPIRDEGLFYEPGDILLGKCRNNPLWPCVIERFLGYDEEEVQVYHVSFLSTNSVANLETYNLLPVTKVKLERMKRSRIYRSCPGVTHSSYVRAVREAEARIEKLKRAAKNDFFEMGRFMKLYCSDANEHETFIEVQNIRSLPTQEMIRKRKHRLSKLKIYDFCSITVEISSSGEEDKRVMAVFNEAGTTCFTVCQQPKDAQQPTGNVVTVDVYNWEPSLPVLEQ